MPTIKTENQLREEKVAQMGVQLGELHFLLWKDLTWLHFEWDQFSELFGATSSRIDVMNAAAPRFFWSLERVLWQDILLSLSRLADPTGTGGQQNLTFRRLLSLLPKDGPREQLLSALNEYEQKSLFARDWRHSLFAHRALDHAANPDAHPLKEASRADVISALEAAAQVMNIVELHYQDSTTGYGAAHGQIGGAYDLLYLLDRGLHAREIEEDSEEVWNPRFS